MNERTLLLSGDIYDQNGYANPQQRTPGAHQALAPSLLITIMFLSTPQDYVYSCLMPADLTGFTISLKKQKTSPMPTALLHTMPLPTSWLTACSELNHSQIES